MFLYRKTGDRLVSGADSSCIGLIFVLRNFPMDDSPASTQWI